MTRFMTKKLCNINIEITSNSAAIMFIHFVISKLIWLAAYQKIRVHVHKSDYENSYIILLCK